MFQLNSYFQTLFSAIKFTIKHSGVNKRKKTIANETKETEDVMDVLTGYITILVTFVLFTSQTFFLSDSADFRNLISVSRPKRSTPF